MRAPGRRTLGWACQVRGQPEDLEKVENRTGLGPHISPRNQGLSGMKFQIQAQVGTPCSGALLRIWSKNTLEKSPEGGGGLLIMQTPTPYLS